MEEPKCIQMLRDGVQTLLDVMAVNEEVIHDLTKKVITTADANILLKLIKKVLRTSNLQTALKAPGQSLHACEYTGDDFARDALDIWAKRHPEHAE